MTAWQITPRDPLVFSDGRPNDGRSQSGALPFPFPGTMAGIARTRAGSDPNKGWVLKRADLPAVLKTRLRGPLPVTGGELFVPAPRDAVLTQRPSGASWCLRPIYPLARQNNIACDAGFVGEDLEMAGQDPADHVPGKPPRKMPAYWPMATLTRWLLDDVAARRSDDASTYIAGLAAFEGETRTHVQIGLDGVAADGMLFSRTGHRLQSGKLGATHRAADLWLDFDPGTLNRTITPGLAPMGGERRLAYWTQSKAVLPDVSQALLDYVKRHARVRVVLLTPAIFAPGFRPGPGSPLLEPVGALTPRLVSAVVDRPQVISGWSFETRAPKPTRRLAPAGSTYWFDLDGTPADRATWVANIWMENISDDPQDRNDGYGLAAIGVA